MNRYVICLVVCLTLGLAPFRPEPHIVEKMRWVLHGAAGMRLIDWFDLVLHGTPWTILIGLLVRDIWRKVRPPTGAPS